MSSQQSRGDEVGNQQHFVAFVPPSSGFIWQIHKTALSEIIPLDGGTNATKRC